MLTEVKDLLHIMGWEPLKRPKQTNLFVVLSEEEKIIEAYFKEKETESLDSIALECGLPIFKVASILLNLELKGVVQPLPGKLFQWIQ